MQGEPGALVTTGVTWLASLYPPQSSQLQNKKTTQPYFHHGGSLQSPTGTPGRMTCPSHPTLSDLTPKSFSVVGDLGRGAAGAPRVVSRVGKGVRTQAGYLLRGHQATEKWPWLELCLPQTPWSWVSKKQKQDLSVPQSPGEATIALSPRARLLVLGRGQQRTPQKTAQSQVRG